MSLKILLADDSMTAQNMGKKILSDAGYEVVAVSNGAAAVKKIAEHKPDVAILDIYMPGYTGLEVCERVKGTLETSRMPVLLTVGKMEPYRVEDGARVRSDGVIVKPFEATDLIAAVEKLAQKMASSKPAWKRDTAESTDDPNEIETSSFQALKDEVPENTAPERFTVSQEMQSAPAMDFASIGIEPVEHEIVSAAELAINAPVQLPEAEIVADNSVTPWQPAGFVMEEASIDKDDEPIFASAPAIDPELDLPPVTELPETPAGVQPFEVEFTSAASVGEIEVQAAPELETDRAELIADVETVADPGLLAADEVATAFPTAFGTEVVAGADEQHSNDASAETFTDLPTVSELPPISASTEETSSAGAPESSDEFESRVAAAMAAYEKLETPTVSAEPASVSAWHAEQVEVDAAEKNVSLEAELAEQFPSMNFNSAPDFAPMPSLDAMQTTPATSLMVVESAAHEVPATPESATHPDIASEPEPASAVIETRATEIVQPETLAATAASTFGAFAAAGMTGAAPEAESTTTPEDDARIASAIQRVLERLKPQIVSEIARELSKKDD